MTAGECMTREFQTLHPDASVEEVIRRLKVPEADPIPVCDGDWLIGMVGYRDVATGVTSGTRRGGPVRARDLVAADLIYCRETTEVEEAIALMRDNEVRSLPVLNRDGRLVGILSMANVPADLEPSRQESERSRDPGRRGT